MASWWTAFWTVVQRAFQRAILGTASTKLRVYAPGQRPKPQFYRCLCACSTLPLWVTLLAVTALRTYVWNVLRTGHTQLPTLRQVMGHDKLYSACTSQEWDFVWASMYKENSPLSHRKMCDTCFTEGMQKAPQLRAIRSLFKSYTASPCPTTSCQTVLLLAIPLYTAFTLTITLIAHN